MEMGQGRIWARCELREKVSFAALTLRLFQIRQSNSRVIRWSDGTLSLRLGKELFDINQSIDTSGGASRGLFGGSQVSQSQSQSVPLASQQTGISGAKSQGLTYLVAQHKRAQLLQAEAVITGYMTLRPTGMQSETHRMLVRAVGQKHNKVARLRMAPDPKTDPAREVTELIRVAAKKSKKRPEEDEFGGRKRRSGHSRKRTADVWSDDEEPEDMASEDEDDDLTGRSRKVKPKTDEEAKKRRWDYEEDDFVVADSSDEGSEGGTKTKKRERAVDDVVEDDPLDQMEAKLKEQDREGRKKRQRKANETKDVDVSETPDRVGDGDDDEEMDIESEEMEEDIKVRRAGVGPRRKRAIDFEEEEEEEEEK
jgi:RNA polymerase-associated protein LEO1